MLNCKCKWSCIERNKISSAEILVKKQLKNAGNVISFVHILGRPRP